MSLDKEQPLTEFNISPENICSFVAENYACYQDAWLCGKSSEILCYLLRMAGIQAEKVSCEINGYGHIYVRCGDLNLDPSIKQFGNYPMVSRGDHPCHDLGYFEMITVEQPVVEGANQLTREKAQWLHDTCEEAAAAGIKLTMNPNELLMFTSYALAAMDSAPVELPLDYLQGHKDGLEWADQLAEANHPETGYWLYDDPIELAKAIRKGQDMPPAQPVADSEPDHNPVLAYADSYRDMAKQGVESVPIWSVITDLERNISPLYRHAQPAPELSAIVERLNLSGYEYEGGEVTPQNAAAIVDTLLQQLDDAVQCRNAQPAPVVPVVPDEMLCEFYEVNNWTDLVRELVKHVEQLQDSAKRNVKPWEDTFPETMLPAYIERIKQADDACRAAMLNGGKP